MFTEALPLSEVGVATAQHQVEHDRARRSPRVSSSWIRAACLRSASLRRWRGRRWWGGGTTDKSDGVGCDDDRTEGDESADKGGSIEGNLRGERDTNNKVSSIEPMRGESWDSFIRSHSLLC